MFLQPIFRQNYGDMWRKILFAAALCMAGMQSRSQEVTESALFLAGAPSPEDVEEELLEQYTALALRPVRINMASEGRLASCGLFGRYQAASIADYRRTYGDILSVAELALLDGFGEAVARALAPFVSFETRAAPGSSSLEKGRVRTEAMMRSLLQESDGLRSGSYAAKLRTGDEDRWLLSATGRKTAFLGFRPFRDLSASAALYGRKLQYKLVLGDFNARFGQGLLLWSGFSLSGVQSAAAMDRHPTGLSPAWTLSPVHRGAAADLTLGRFVLSGFWSYGKDVGANVTWLARRGQLGLTGIRSGRGSVDGRLSAGKWDVFGEAAADFRGGACAFVAGAAWNPAYQVRLAASVRSYPAAFDGSLAGALRSSSKSSDERGAALAFDYKSLVITSDAAFHPSKGTSQYKTIVKYAPQVTETLSLAFRAVSRYRPMDPYPWRKELRAEAVLGGSGGFSVKGDASFCHNMELSWLTYVEPGYVLERDGLKWSFHLRGTAFKVDNWEDRIYVYERDIQGAFSVPAYYGRGCSLSAVTAVKRRHFTLGARAFATAYPGMGGKKPGKTGLRLQCLFTF